MEGMRHGFACEPGTRVQARQMGGESKRFLVLGWCGRPMAVPRPHDLAASVAVADVDDPRQTARYSFGEMPIRR